MELYASLRKNDFCQNKFPSTFNMVHLLDVPEEILRYISRFLMIEDVIHLSIACKFLFHVLPTYSLDEKVIDVPNTCMWGTCTNTEACTKWETPSPDKFPINPTNPSHWSFCFETPPFTSRIFMVTISAAIIYENHDFL